MIIITFFNVSDIVQNRNIKPDMVTDYMKPLLCVFSPPESILRPKRNRNNNTLARLLFPIKFVF